MERPISDWTGKILKAAGQSGTAVHNVNRVLIDSALDQVDKKTIARREYLNNSEHVGPDYRL